MISRLFVLFLSMILGMNAAQANPFGAPRLEIVAQMKERPGNIAVAADGRMFVSVHPFEGAKFKVLQVSGDGTTKPYPNESWAGDPDANGVGLSNVIHLAMQGEILYLLDMGTRTATPKLVAWNTTKNTLDRVWYIPAHAVTPQSFLQDFVITPDAHHVVIADMGQADLTAKADPALIHLDLQTGLARRILATHASVRPSEKPMMAGGNELRVMKDAAEKPLHLGVNPITLDPKGEWLYFAPMGQGILARLRMSDAVNPKLSDVELAARVQNVGQKPPSDGMIVDGMQNVFITSVNEGAIGIINNKGKYTTWIRDPLLIWPDGLAFGPDQAIYATINQLHLASIFHKGEEKSAPPYMIVRIIGGRPLIQEK